MKRPTPKVLPICAGVGALAVAAIAIPAWAASGSDERKPSVARGFGAVQRGGRPLPIPSAPERRRLDARLEDFRSCMSEHGIDLPQPPQGRGGFAIPVPPPPPGARRDRGEVERAPIPAGSHRGDVEPAPVPGGDEEAFREAVEECGGPPLPPPPFGVAFRRSDADCGHLLPRKEVEPDRP